MEDQQTCENYPARIVILANLFSVSIYAIGAYVLLGLGIWAAILYLLYCLWIEISLLRRSCVDCYYYGKACAFGRGKLCSILFKKGVPQKFIQKEISLSKMLPDFMVSLFPIIGGIVLLVMDFSWPIVVLLGVLAILSSAGNAFVRGTFACKRCKQRELGCPAEQLFSKQQQNR
ncbi:MAG: hypothetical protein SVM79_01165 [Chloroflexota bacterium]|nr:hypothetical protein [Chloroflexota bacterium]